jgi:exodeoxyribonuclease-3
MAPRSSKKEPDAASGTPNKHDRVTRGSTKTPPSAASIDSQKTSEAPLKKSAKRTLPEDTTKENSPKKKAPTHQVLTERDDIPRLWSDEQAAKNGSYTMRIASWNVAGLRALMRNSPHALSDFVREHNVDVLCLQETKLQESHLDDPKLKIRGHLLEKEGFDSYYSCSTARKGYSGTSVFVKRRQLIKGSKVAKKQKTLGSYFGKNDERETSSNSLKGTEELSIDPHLLVPEGVSFQMNVDKHDSEGRIVVVDFPSFTMCNVYVPNSGQKLERLSYRTEEWDKDFLSFIQKKQKDRGVPVLWLGDLNVAHTNLEVWNDGAKHLAKQAGVTAEERASFEAQLNAGFIDAFRRLHPTAKGHYSYWSQRAGNREPNKGLRLDYFICDPSLFDEESKTIVRDSYVLPLQQGSDHCPVVLELEIKA